MSSRKSIPRGHAITPHGPGAIVDSGQESFVVLDTVSNRRAWDTPEQTIRLERLERKLGVDSFRLPPAGSGFREGSKAPLNVQRFPAWLFCPRCRQMVKSTPNIEFQFEGGEPRCETCVGSILVPMRYISVCTNGHLDDIDWWLWAHSQSKSNAGPCTRQHPDLRFIAKHNSGSANKALAIRCERCKSERSLEDITKGSLRGLCGQKCSGRQPWQKIADAETCSLEPRALLRSQTAVHFSDIVSALDLEDSDPEDTEELVQYLREKSMDFIDEGVPISDSLKTRWAKRASEKFARNIDLKVVNRILSELASGKTSHTDLETTDTLDEEWPKLAQPSQVDSRYAPLRVRASDWTKETDTSILGDLLESVMLVERLREVRALQGFRRVEPGGKLIRPDLNRRLPWLPATEVFGEGLFIQLSNAALLKWEQQNAHTLEERTHVARQSISNGTWVTQRFPIEANLLARFKMVHTFAHLLMRQLTFECGYSGAALRERLYVFADRCGLLIYTADADSEGSLGGLVRQGKRDRIADTILSAIARAHWCSNDPICAEMPDHGPEKLNRSACHACSLVAETSCTHSNLLLDRMLVIGDGERGPVGYFHDFI